MTSRPIIGYSPVATDSPQRLSVQHTRSDMAPQQQKKWEVFPGRNKFCCDGKIMIAKSAGVFYLTCALIIVTSGFFFGFDCPFLAINVSPAIPIVGGLMFLFVMSVLLRTSFSDPGIIPRATVDEANDVEQSITANPDEPGTFRPPPRVREVYIKGQLVKLKYCFTCKIFRPPRASHCSLCDNCVERFDHHCPWVGNCVGKRNYRYFYLFLTGLSLYCIFIFACVIAHLVLAAQQSDFLTAIKENPVSIVGGMIVGLVDFCSIWSVIGLWGFHSYLIVSETTTNEDIKGSFGRREVTNPFSNGACTNFCSIVCGPQPPSLIDAEGVFVPESTIVTMPVTSTRTRGNGSASSVEINAGISSSTSGYGTSYAPSINNSDVAVSASYNYNTRLQAPAYASSHYADGRH